MPMDETQWSLQRKESVRTPVTYEEGFRHPRTHDNVGLSMFDHSCMNTQWGINNYNKERMQNQIYV